MRSTQMDCAASRGTADRRLEPGRENCGAAVAARSQARCKREERHTSRHREIDTDTSDTHTHTHEDINTNKHNPTVLISLCLLFLAHYQVKNLEEKTPLFFAAYRGSVPMCKALLISGANPNATDVAGNTRKRKKKKGQRMSTSMRR